MLWHHRFRSISPSTPKYTKCLKFEGDEAYEDIEILDVVSFLARQVNEKKAQVAGETQVQEPAEA